jgi:hypothetical protein
MLFYSYVRQDEELSRLRPNSKGEVCEGAVPDGDRASVRNVGSSKNADSNPNAIAAALVKVKPFRSRITGPEMEVEMVIAATF